MEKTYLSKGRGVKSVLAGNLKTDGVSSLGVPCGLGTSLDLGVHTVVVASSEEGEVVGGSDGSGVLRERVGNGGRVLGDSGLLDVITALGTDQETLMPENGIEVGSWALEEVEESTGVQVGLFEVEVQLGAFGVGVWEVLCEDLGFETLSNVVVQLELGVEGVVGGPCLGESET